MKSGKTFVVGGRRTQAGGFTLLELLICISVIGLLTCILVPSLALARQTARRTVCANNLRTVQLAHMFYLENNDGGFFPWQTKVGTGYLWYWGLEPGDSSSVEGSRTIDVTQAYLYPYLPTYEKMKMCPTIPYGQSYFKAKFNLAGYGYGINKQLLWSKQNYIFDVELWLKGDNPKAPPPESRHHLRNTHWRHLNSMRVLSMPDKWEYPWFAAWDLAFHTVAIAMIDPPPTCARRTLG